MWKTTNNVCSTLSRYPNGRFHLAAILQPLARQTFGRAFSFKQLVASSFYKARNIFKYVFNKNAIEFKPANYTNVLVRNVSAAEATPFSSVLGRFVAGKQFSVRRFNAYFENARFKTINRRHLTGAAGISLGLVGVCIKDENGYPLLLHDSPSKPFTWQTILQTVKTQIFDLKNIREDINSVNCIEFKDCVSKGCAGVVYKANIDSRRADVATPEPVAVKMLFNYDIESNSMAIINSSIKECVPYNGTFGGFEISRKKLPPHPNIVKIISVFTDYFQPLQNCQQLYPHALPLQFGGYGRNMTLFVVEKLYDMNLKQYLSIHVPSSKCSLAMLTQCFDAVDFMRSNGIAHRDLKCDNILVSLGDDDQYFPWLVISDFGLCSTSLVLPFQTDEICRGGNRALMAPEIVCAKPSQQAVLDYSKADLWSLGTIAYEMFNAENPFYRRTPSSNKLDSATYDENELPPFPSDSKPLVELMRRILQRDPNQRPTTELAAELTQLLFHMGTKGVASLLRISDSRIRNKLIDQWLRSFTLQCIYRASNSCENVSFDFKMKLIFVTKMQTEKVKALFEKLIYL